MEFAICTKDMELLKLYSKEKTIFFLLNQICCYLLKDNQPGRFSEIAGNTGNHGNDGKFHESHKILNQI